jgi:hypothetical protein
LQHDHFITNAGAFGSHDEHGEQVDRANFKVVDDNTVSFPSHATEFGYDGDLVVDYSIDGDVVAFDVAPACSVRGRVPRCVYLGSFRVRVRSVGARRSAAVRGDRTAALVRASASAPPGQYSSNRGMRAFVSSLLEDGVMVTATAEWVTYGGWQGERVVTDPQEALDLCAEIEANENSGRVLVGFTSAVGHFFAVGLGFEESCAMYREFVDPPYFQSVGPLAPDDRIDFAYDGQHTEFPGTVRIRKDSALQALSEFIETGLRPDCIEWEQT